MNKILKYVLIVFIVFLAPVEAEANLKMDITAGISRMMGSIEAFVKDVQEQVKQAAKDLQEKINGSKIPAMIETAKALSSTVQAVTASGQAIYSDTMANVDELKDEYEETIEEFKKTELGKSTELTKQKLELDEQIQARQDVLSEEVTAKKKAAQENYETLQAMQNAATDQSVQEKLAAEIEETQAQLNRYNEDLQQINSGEGTYLEEDSEYKSLIAQREQVLQQLLEAGKAAGTQLVQDISGLLSKDDAQKAKEYNKVIEDNFLKPDEPENAENVKRVIQNRQKVLLEDIVYAFSKAVTLKLQLDEDLDETIKIQENITGVDQKMTAGNLLIQQRILDTKILYNYTDLMIAELRLKTAQNMANQAYRLKNYDKNPAVLDLDSYTFTKKDVKSDAGKKSFLENVSQKRKKK